MTMTKVACLLAFASLSRVGAFLPFAWHRAPSRAPRAARAAVVAVAPDKRLDSTIDELMNRMEERRPELMPQLLGKRLDVLTDSRFLPRLETRRTDQGVPPQQAAELEALGELVLSFLEELTDRVREIEPEWQQEQAQADAVTAKAAEKARAALRGLKSTPPRRRGGGADPAGAPPVPAVAPGQGATDEAVREALSAVVAAPRASNFAAFAAGIRGLQEAMIAQATEADPAARWTVDEHSRGRAVIVEDGDVWEKGCISVTLIEGGALTATRAESISARTGSDAIVEGARYSACALSFVLHAKSPHVPTLRGDVRIFAVDDAEEWYGGGIDLTPSYVEPDDCAHFHGELARLCAAHGEAGTYRAMKKTCDDYFYIPCRGEHRGVGGVFFDDLSAPWAPGFCDALMRAALDDAGPYMPIVRKRLAVERAEGHTPAQKEWQCLRRGRYVEFNLLYDRGVKFGLTPEAVERVLVSSPPYVAFKYKTSSAPPEGSREAETLEVLRRPRDWAPEER